jgi:hypothetical protein
MNYDRFKKVIVSMALIFVFAFSTIVASVTPVSAQGYYPRRYGWERQYYRPAYRYPYSGRYYRHRYGIYNRYYGYPYYNPYRYSYPYGHYRRYGRFRWGVYY